MEIKITRSKLKRLQDAITALERRGTGALTLANSLVGNEVTIAILVMTHRTSLAERHTYTESQLQDVVEKLLGQQKLLAEE